MNIAKRLKVFLAAALLTALAAGSLPAQDQAGSATRRIGLFIGSNNGGRDRVTLRYAVSDARAVSRVFADMGGISREDNILLVEPNAAEINRRLDALGRELSSARRNNSQRTELVFYYSGHSDEEGLLLGRQRYGYRDLRERINRIDADMRIVILDSCASGAITRAKGGAKAPPFLFDSSVSVEGYAYLTSSSADETSQESDRIESSYFTHSLLAGLRGAADTLGDGRVTLNELYRFAYTETLAQTETSLYGAQHPSYDMQLSGTGDVVLTDIKETSASLLIGEELTGRITVRDDSDFLVVELTKVNPRPMELGLAPGPYRIMLQRGNDFYRAEVFLRENNRTPLEMGDFTRIASAEGGRRRGNEGDQSSDPGGKNGHGVYTFFVNVVPEGFRFPLIGFVNIALGNHNSAQLGFINWNTRDFTGLQGGFINTVGGGLYGVQGAFLNTVAGDFTGFQSGFVNTAVRGGHGLQLGFVNVSMQKLRGAQVGFVNYADSIEGGVPVGFLSIVRRGGYYAAEYSFTEFHPFTLGFKVGVERFYTTFFAALNPFEDQGGQMFASGVGFGTLIPIMKGPFFFNPEINSVSSFTEGKNVTAFVPYLGWNLNKRFSVTAGPSVSWSYTNSAPEPLRPWFNLWGFNGDNNIAVTLGVRAALRYRF